MIRDDDLLDGDGVRRVVGEVCFPDPSAEHVPGQIGLEVERFPIRFDASGVPVARVPVDGPGPSSLTILDDLARSRPEVLGSRRDAGVPRYPLPGGGTVTFEPGGVVERATGVHSTAAGALAEEERVASALSEVCARHGTSLASIGTDPWHPAASIPLQLRSFRYTAMSAYLARRGPAGRVIMRNTASVQVSLDVGSGAARADRWLVANAISPLLTATFANSPDSDGAVCARARAWQECDATRTGFPPALVRMPSPEPVEQMSRAALAADVLLVRTAPGRAVPGTPGWTFGAWLRHGHRVFGRPTAGDLRYHLSTLFHEVRPRGTLELRAIDAVPRRWRPVPLVLVCGAVEDPVARERLLALLGPRVPELPLWWHAAARSGVADPSFCAVAVEAWSHAMRGAARLPDGYLPPGALAVAEEFLERFTLRGRCPADELLEQLARGPAEALAWAAEPVPERAGETA